VAFYREKIEFRPNGWGKRHLKKNAKSLKTADTMCHIVYLVQTDTTTTKNKVSSNYKGEIAKIKITGGKRKLTQMARTNVLLVLTH
jgi:hypothetical protein